MSGIKQGLFQTLQQKLSPQQIQFVKLLQLPTTAFEERIKEELEENPTLEEGDNEGDDLELSFSEPTSESKENATDDNEEEFDNDFDSDNQQDFFEEYMSDDDVDSYKTNPDEERDEIPVAQINTLLETVQGQADLLSFNATQKAIAQVIIGSLEEDGYLRTSLDSIQDDLDFRQNIKVTLPEIEYVLSKIQNLEPIGIAARSLQECLTVQLKAMQTPKNTKDIQLCLLIVHELFDEFSKKHYEKMMRKLDVSESKLKELIEMITHLNPKPGESQGSSNIKTEYIIPDFTVVREGDDLRIILNSKNAPDLRINRQYQEILVDYEKSNKPSKEMKDMVTFIKSKIESARWFIDAIRQRQNTLMITMQTIVNLQKEFFFIGDESSLKPMVLKDVAERIQMDISTVSRVANSKYVETDFGLYQLKYFFSEGISTESGTEVSNKEVKRALKDFVESEDKHKPYSDDELAEMLNKKGYNIARRTVAKYREQLEIPVARLRRKLMS